MGEKVMEGQGGGLKHSDLWISNLTGFCCCFKRKNSSFKQILKSNLQFSFRSEGCCSSWHRSRMTPLPSRAQGYQKSSDLALVNEGGMGPRG